MKTYIIISKQNGEVLRARHVTGIRRAREVFRSMVAISSRFAGAYVIATDDNGNEVDIFAKEVKHGDSVERPASQTPSSD